MSNYLSRKFSGREYVREVVRIRDKRTCQSCGKKWMDGQRRFDVHHLNNLCGLKSRSYDRLSDIDGLITLCHKCHYNRHDFNGMKNNPLKPPKKEQPKLLPWEKSKLRKLKEKRKIYAKLRLKYNAKQAVRIMSGGCG